MTLYIIKCYQSDLSASGSEQMLCFSGVISHRLLAFSPSQLPWFAQFRVCVLSSWVSLWPPPINTHLQQPSALFWLICVLSQTLWESTCSGTQAAQCPQATKRIFRFRPAHEEDAWANPEVYFYYCCSVEAFLSSWVSRKSLDCHKCFILQVQWLSILRSGQ